MSRRPEGRRDAGFAVIRWLIAALAISAASPTSTRADAWSQEKCSRYDKAFQELLDMVGSDGVTQDFITGNKAFIAAGCSNGAGRLSDLGEGFGSGQQTHHRGPWGLERPAHSCRSSAVLDYLWLRQFAVMRGQHTLH
ncbi:MAG: hypothetical protein KL863_27005 [Rhizobium sp.]|nr:hypothetical protein [Rhizobium sp.]